MITRFDRTHERDRQTLCDGMPPAALMHRIARQTFIQHHLASTARTAIPLHTSCIGWL